MRTVTCDRCGKVIPKGDAIGHITTWYEDLKDLDKATPGYHGWDFCMECMDGINDYIKIIPRIPEAHALVRSTDETTVETLDKESEDEPINEPITEPERWPIDEPKGEPKIKWVAVRNALADQWDEQERKAEEAGPDAANHGHIRKKADWPKFKACVDAGRDDKWLAVEFGVTTRTIWTWRKKLAAMEETK